MTASNRQKRESTDRGTAPLPSEESLLKKGQLLVLRTAKVVSLRSPSSPVSVKALSDLNLRLVL